LDMIYSILLYQSKSGLLLYEKNFKEISNGKSEMFSSFFSAMKSFVSEMVLDGSKELKKIELGDSFIIITEIEELNADLAITADKKDYKAIQKLIPKVIKIFLNHKELFIDWVANVNDFMILEQPLTKLLSSNNKLLNESSTLDEPKKLLQSIWAHKEDPTEVIKDNLIQEREILISRLKKVLNYQKRLTIIEKVIQISEQLKDDEAYIQYQKEANVLSNEIKDRKIKLNYYLESTKKSLSEVVNHLGNKPLKEGDYKYVYLNLYSFAQKLKNLTKSKTRQKYIELAEMFINKDILSNDQLSELISSILSMKENAEEYI